jgi:hypothetical protein
LFVTLHPRSAYAPGAGHAAAGALQGTHAASAYRLHALPRKLTPDTHDAAVVHALQPGTAVGLSGAHGVDSYEPAAHSVHGAQPVSLPPCTHAAPVGWLPHGHARHGATSSRSVTLRSLHITRAGMAGGGATHPVDELNPDAETVRTTAYRPGALA